MMRSYRFLWVLINMDEHPVWIVCLKNNVWKKKVRKTKKHINIQNFLGWKGGNIFPCQFLATNTSDSPARQKKSENIKLSWRRRCRQDLTTEIDGNTRERKCFSARGRRSWCFQKVWSGEVQRSNLDMLDLLRNLRGLPRRLDPNLKLLEHFRTLGTQTPVFWLFREQQTLFEDRSYWNRSFLCFWGCIVNFPMSNSQTRWAVCILFRLHFKRLSFADVFVGFEVSLCVRPSERQRRRRVCEVFIRRSSPARQPASWRWLWSVSARLCKTLQDFARLCKFRRRARHETTCNLPLASCFWHPAFGILSLSLLCSTRLKKSGELLPGRSCTVFSSADFMPSCLHAFMPSGLPLHFTSAVFLSIYIYLSIYLSISIYLYLSLSISIYLYLSLSISIYLYLSLSISIYLYLSLSISIYLYLSLSISIYLYLSIYL